MRPGQTVGLVAPSFALAKPHQLQEAVASLEGFGYHVKVGESCLARHGCFAGPDALRAEDINHMFRDDAVDAILCARGGYGATRMLHLLDYDAIRANPKVFSGYSDVTALHASLMARAGLVTFHGLMAASDLAADGCDPFSLDAFWRVVSNPVAAGPLRNPAGSARYAIAPGKAQGPLAGGNLTMLASLLGTPYAPDTEGALLFIEEVGEHTYAVDRLLTQLENAGTLARVAGIVLGAFTACEPEKPDHFSLEAVLRERLGHLGVPVLAGVCCGHVTPKLTLPLGVLCAMDAEAGTLSALEAAVR